MRVAVDTAALAVEDTQVSLAVPVELAWLAGTLELGSAEDLAPMRRDLIHLESQRDATTATADMGKSTTHREFRLEARFMVLVTGRKVEPLPSSLLGRRAIPVAITFRKIDPGLVLRLSPLSSRVIMREKIGI
jgi:hypothetical protein